MCCRCDNFYVKADFFLKFFCQMSYTCARHDQFLENSSRISQFVDDLIIPVFCLCIYHLACCSLCILTGLLSCQKEVKVIRHMKKSLCLLQIFRMFCLNCHQLVYRIVNSFLDTCSCIQFFKWNDLVNFFIHSLCTMVAVSDCVTKYLVIFIKKNEVNTPGINAHAYRNLADLFTFLKTCNDFFKNTVKFPAEFSILLYHTILKTMNLLELHSAILHVSKDQTSTGCSHVYCCVILSHCKNLLNVFLLYSKFLCANCCIFLLVFFLIIT